MTGKQPLRIAIATGGRFHVLDLARELDALGHQVLFYSYVPKRRALKFGLPARCHVALLPMLAPLIAFSRLCGRTRLAPLAASLLNRAADRLVALRLRPCDVFIGMSGMYIEAPKQARTKFGAKIVVERGSTHIETQKEILDAIRALNPRATTVRAADVAREVQSYVIADRVVVPSLHAEASFLERGFPAEKLFRNPYGVDLATFRPDVKVRRDPQLVLFVGGWSYQKGVDLLMKAMHDLAPRGFRLRHIGSIADAPVPTAPWFHSEGHVDQRALPGWYQRARCLVLPSRQEGLSLVQVQALACGCPVVGSTMSGAADLQDIVPDNRSVQVVLIDDKLGLIEAIKRCNQHLDGAVDATQLVHTQLSWGAYARRYDAMLSSLVRAPLQAPCKLP